MSVDHRDESEQTCTTSEASPTRYVMIRYESNLGVDKQWNVCTGKVYRAVLTEVTFHQYYFKGPTADRSGDQVRGVPLCVCAFR